MVHTRSALVGASMIALCVCASFADADVMFLDQMRTVGAHSSVSDGIDTVVDDEMDSAADFDIYERLVDADSLIPFAFAHGDAYQSSWLTQEFIGALGTAGAGVVADADHSAQGNGFSYFDVTFSLDGPAVFMLDVELMLVESASTLSDLTFGFTGPDGPVAMHTLFDNDEWSYFGDGVLPAGEYRLAAYATASFGDSDAVVGGARASYFISLIVPEPATVMFLLVGGWSLVGGRRR